MKRAILTFLAGILSVFAVNASANSDLEPITRQEFVSMTVKTLGYEKMFETVPFSDVTNDNPYFEELLIAKQTGLLKGDEYEKANPTDFLTRSEAAAILGRAASSYDKKDLPYYDKEEIPLWAREYISGLTELNILRGHTSGDFEPNGTLTKEQAKIIMDNLINNRFLSGDGSQENPYIITKPYHFLSIKHYPDKCFEIHDDIFFSGEIIFDSIKEFSGNLQGNGRKITGLLTTLSGKDAIFGKISKNSTVSGINLVLKDGFVKLAEENFGLIENCGASSFKYDETEKYFEQKRAGIALKNDGIIKNCYNSSYIFSFDMAGICYENNGIVENCFNTASSKEGGYGITARNKGKIINSYNTGNVLYPISPDGETQNTYFTSKKNGTGEQKSVEYIVRMLEPVGFSYSSKHKIPVLNSIYFIAGEDFALYGGGDGTKQNPYVINSAVHFDNIRLNPNGFFVLKADIDVSELENYAMLEVFGGNLQGNGYGIYNLKKALTENQDFSLIYKNNGRLENIRLVDFYINTGGKASAIAIINNQDIVSCYADGGTYSKNSGGLVYENNGFIEKSAFSGTVSGVNTSGVCYENNGEITDCFVDASLFGVKGSGITHINNGKITASLFVGEIDANEKYALSFVNTADIKACYYGVEAVSVGDNKGNVKATKRTAEQLLKLDAFDEFDKSIWKQGEKTPVLKNIRQINRTRNVKDFSGGDGSIKNPYKIVTPMQLNAVRNYNTSCFILLNDIDLAKQSLLPIEEFKGVFLGNGKKITGFNKGKTKGALFVTNSGIIEGLTTAGGGGEAGIALNNRGTILKCRNENELSSNTTAGIAVFNYGTISECMNTGDIKGLQAGAIAYKNTGKIINCQNSGNVFGIGENHAVYGIASGGDIKNCLSVSYLVSFEGDGKIYPISQNGYKNSYYLNRFGGKEQGGLTLKDFASSTAFSGFDFENVWSFEKGTPVLKEFINYSYEMPKTFSGGSGTEAEPYIISTLSDLNNIRMYPTAHYKIVADLVFDKNEPYLSGKTGFEPVKEFKGVLDGGGHSIYNFEINGDSLENSGLFEINNGTVKNLTLVRFTVTGKDNAGAVCGTNKGDIENVKVLNSRIGAKTSSGAICGTNTKKVTACKSESDVFGGMYAGGISGVNNSLITLCTSKGGVIAFSEEDSAYAGGISGISRSKINFSLSSAKTVAISQKGEAQAGGISGMAAGEIKDVINLGEISSKSGSLSYTGGILGKAPDKVTVTNALSRGYVISTSDNAYTGSVVGSGNGKILKTLYDVTLVQPVGGGDFYFSELIPVSDFSSPELINVLGEENWNLGFGNGGLYPQLIKNPHTETALRDNIRDFAGGNGSYESPYLIITPEQLNNVRYYLGSCFMLLSDIDMTDFCANNGFKPIGEDKFAFFGTFLGNGFEIRGITAEKGLFSANHGDIYELMLTDFTLLSDIGGFVSNVNTGTVYRCTLENANVGNNDGFLFVGGIVNTNYSSGMIISSLNKSNLDITAKGIQYAGVCLTNYGIVAGSSNEGNINLTAQSYAVSGGVVGTNYKTVSDCLNKGNMFVLCPTQINVGGICANNSGSVISCISQAKSNVPMGGICNLYSSGESFNCYYLNGAGITDRFSSGTDDVLNSELLMTFDFETTWDINDLGEPCLKEIMY